MSSSHPSRHEDPGLKAFAQSDPSGRSTFLQMPDLLVFDTDTKRDGAYGGFFLANDYNAQSYEVSNRTLNPNEALRINGPNQKIPGIHLPALVHFALVADGPLFTTPGNSDANQVFNFEAIVLCREALHRETHAYGLFKLTLKGPAAVKLHRYMTIDVEDPLRRIDAYYHDYARQLFRLHQIPRSRLEHILKQQATPQLFWIPVPIVKGVEIGQGRKSVTGAMVYTDAFQEHNKKRPSRWSFVTTESLITPSMHGGLQLEYSVQQFCQNSRARYQSALRLRAQAKGQIRDLRYPIRKKRP